MAVVSTQNAPTVTPTPSATAEATATPTVTNTPTSTPTPDDTPTPTLSAEQIQEMTAEALVGCIPDISVENVYTYQTTQNTAAPIDLVFPLTFVVRYNGGVCPWPEGGVEIVYQEGNDFDQDGPATSTTIPVEGEDALVTISLQAPSRVGAYDSTWQVQLPDGQPIGDPISFAVQAYQPVTSTPTQPPAPVATDTPEVADAGPVEFNYFIQNCEYPGGGTEWRCEMLITPYGGVGGEYTIWIFDSSQPARYLGGNQTHFITARRCSPWIHEVKVQSEGNGESISRNIYVDPTAVNSFPGGASCTET